jgi:hypothetical protein
MCNFAVDHGELRFETFKLDLLMVRNLSGTSWIRLFCAQPPTTMIVPAAQAQAPK